MPVLVVAQLVVGRLVLAHHALARVITSS